MCELTIDHISKELEYNKAGVHSEFFIVVGRGRGVLTLRLYIIYTWF